MAPIFHLGRRIVAPDSWTTQNFTPNKFKSDIYLLICKLIKNIPILYLSQAQDHVFDLLCRHVLFPII